MTSVAVLVMVIGVGGFTALWIIPLYRKRAAALAQYWSRPCLGLEWRRTFPDVSSDEIRSFLRLVVDAFGFPPNHALRLAPTDRLEDLYRACYPDPTMPDALELETLAAQMNKRFRVTLPDTMTWAVTLRELFSLTKPAVA